MSWLLKSDDIPLMIGGVKGGCWQPSVDLDCMLCTSGPVSSGGRQVVHYRVYI